MTQPEPENPEDPEEPADPEDKPEEENPKTADVAMTGVFAMLLFAVCGIVLVIGKKNFVR